MTVKEGHKALCRMKEEYVCPMPFDVDTANIGLRWWACQALQNFTGAGEGVEWAVNEPYGQKL